MLLHTHTSIFVLILNVLVARDQDSGRDRLVSELVLNHVFFLHFLLHNHFIDLDLSCRRLSGLLVTKLKAEWLGHSHSKSTFSQGFLFDLMHVVVCRDTLAA